MVQVIERADGRKSVKRNYNGAAQISYNSDGNVCIRLVENCNKDTLIVLNEATSRKLKDFLDQIQMKHRFGDCPF